MTEHLKMLSSGMWSKYDDKNSRELREIMVVDQIQSRGIQQDRILEAFLKVPRHQFITHVHVEEAYGDHPVHIKAGQTISQPFIVALMLAYLDLNSKHRVLEIGSGSGYATALLSLLCNHVDAMEVFEELIRDAEQVLKRLNLENVTFIHKSAWEQLNTDTVYDRIILWASPSRVPTHLFDSLSNEGGILVTPEGKFDQYVNIYEKRDGKIDKKQTEAVRFVPLVQGTVEEIDRTG